MSVFKESGKQLSFRTYLALAREALTFTPREEELMLLYPEWGRNVFLLSRLEKATDFVEAAGFEIYKEGRSPSTNPK